MAFESEFQHNIDEKGRLILPVRYRDSYGNKCVLSKGFEGCVDVYPMETYKKLEEKLSTLNDFNRRNRDFKRRFFSGTEPCEVDKQGRILIKQEFRAHASLAKEVYIVGVGGHMQIWDKETWEDYRGGISDENYESLAEEIFQ
ncbi:MAG: division/cell wall cluster transcriptional repressor MraZ [Clostridiales bacterium]|nr:division/cell wall cluster transcriptional repressor MraZ [Clostridiales bacterium]